MSGEEVRAVFQDAQKNKYALPAVNVIGSNSINAVLETARDLNSPVIVQFSNGGETAALLPVRYPGSEASSDGLIALSRKTEWLDQGNDLFHGLGQRLLATDTGEYPLLQCREILFNEATSE